MREGREDEGGAATKSLGAVAGMEKEARSCRSEDWTRGDW